MVENSGIGWRRVWCGDFQSSWTLIIHCENVEIMYNLASFIAIVQQAIKKPLVTEILPDHSYARGWRCEANYDQFLSFGQVTFKRFHRQHDSGDWRWFFQKPILNHNLITRTVDCCLTRGGFCSLSAVFTRLFKGYSRVFMSVVTHKESQVLVVPGFHCFCIWTAYFAEFRVLVAPSVQRPFSGERGGVPQCSTYLH